MSNAVKWALLAAGAVALIVLILSMPFVGVLDLSKLSYFIWQLNSYIGGYLRTFRGLINNFLTPTGITILTGLMAYLFCKFFITMGIKLATWIYHFIFRG